MKPAVSVLLLVCAASSLGFSREACAQGGGIDLSSIPNQWEEFTDTSKTSTKAKLRYGAMLFIDTSGRTVKCTHARGPMSNPLNSPYQHSQVNQDAESYQSHTALALAGRVTYEPMEKLSAKGELFLGASWSTLNYEVGAGSAWGSAITPDTSTHLDTGPGFPTFGWKLQAVYEIFDNFFLGGGWRFCYGTGTFDATAFGWTFSSKGFYSFTENTLGIRAEYALEFVKPFLGIGLAFHNGWAELDEQVTGSTREWLLDYRETSQFTFLLGAEHQFDGGHYVRIEFQLIGEWCARFMVGYML